MKEKVFMIKKIFLESNDEAMISLYFEEKEKLKQKNSKIMGDVDFNYKRK